MAKTMVTRLFVSGVVAVLAGIVLVVAAVVVAVGSGMVEFGGPNGFVVNGGSAAWTAVALVFIGGIAIAGGSIAGLVSWIGALINTFQLPDKTWFILLLVLGLWSFGFIAMIVYVLIGPDGYRQPAPITAARPVSPA